jgi:hypothetical protein
MAAGESPPAMPASLLYARTVLHTVHWLRSSVAPRWPACVCRPPAALAGPQTPLLLPGCEASLGPHCSDLAQVSDQIFNSLFNSKNDLSLVQTFKIHQLSKIHETNSVEFLNSSSTHENYQTKH